MLSEQSIRGPSLPPYVNGIPDPKIASPIALSMRTEKIRNKRPAMAAMIVSRPAESRCWSPEDVKTLIEPKTKSIRAMPPARPMAISRTRPAKPVISVGILPRAV